VLQVVRAPFRPVLGALGVDQRWALFAQADEVPARLSVVVQRGGEEALVYRRLDPGHAMFADLLAYRRVRGVYDLSGTAATPSFRRLADALWARVRVEDDGADGLVLKLVRRTTAPPGGVADPTPVSSVHAAVGEVP
jgi:hypothetical protein